MFNTVTNLRLSNKYPLIIYQHPSIKYHIMCRHKYCDCIGCEATNSAPIFFHLEENKATKRLQYRTTSHCNVLERLILNVTSVCSKAKRVFVSSTTHLISSDYILSLLSLRILPQVCTKVTRKFGNKTKCGYHEWPLRHTADFFFDSSSSFRTDRSLCKFMDAMELGKQTPSH